MQFHKKPFQTNVKDSMKTNQYCTACSRFVDSNNPHEVKTHPQLKVLLCNNCYQKHFKDHPSNSCLWCLQSGDFNCQNCGSYICNDCIERNFGRNELIKIIQKAWTCYVCDPSPLEFLVSYCDMLVDTTSDSNEEIDEDSHKDIEKMMDNLREQMEEACQNWYHIKFQIRRKSGLYKNKLELDKEYLSLVSPILWEASQNISSVAKIVNMKQKEIQAKSKPDPNVFNTHKPQQLQQMPEKSSKQPFQNNNNNMHMPTRRNTRENQPEVVKTLLPANYKMTSARMKRSSNTNIEPISYNHRTSRITYSNTGGIKRRMIINEETNTSKISIKKVASSPSHEQEFEKLSPSPPPSKPPNMKFSRIKNVNRNYQYMEPTKPQDSVNTQMVTPSHLYSTVRIKEEPLDDEEEEDEDEEDEMMCNQNFLKENARLNNLSKIKQSSHLSIVKQEPQDDSSLDFIRAPDFSKKHPDSDEDEVGNKDSKSLIESLKNRKGLSIQATKPNVSFKGDYTVSSVDSYTPRANIRHIVDESRDENYQDFATFEYTSESQDKSSAVIDLLKGETSNTCQEPMFLSDEEEFDEKDPQSPKNNSISKTSLVNENHNKNMANNPYHDNNHAFKNSQNTVSQASQDSKFPCTQCGSSFSTQEDQIKHIAQAHDKNQKLPQKTFKIINLPARSFVCNYCDKTFKNKVLLDRHIKIHTISNQEQDRPQVTKIPKGSIP